MASFLSKDSGVLFAGEPYNIELILRSVEPENSQVLLEAVIGEKHTLFYIAQGTDVHISASDDGPVIIALDPRAEKAQPKQGILCGIVPSDTLSDRIGIFSRQPPGYHRTSAKHEPISLPESAQVIQYINEPPRPKGRGIW